MVKRFKNGNMNAKIDRDFYDTSETPFINLVWELEDKDCTILGVEFCMGNYEMAIYLYSYYTDKKYLLSYRDVEKWFDGETIKLYAQSMEQEDYNLLED